MFQTVPLSIIRSFSLYTQEWYMSYRSADSLRAGPCSLSGLLWPWNLNNHLISRQLFPKKKISKLLKSCIHHVRERLDFETATMFAVTGRNVCCL